MNGGTAALVTFVATALTSPAGAAHAAAGCITLLGDVSLARGVGREITRREGNPFQDLVSSGRLADAWVANLEGTMLPKPATKCPRSDGLCLGFEPAALAWLRTAPFRALSLANNHAHDFGDRSFQATVAALTDKGIMALDEESGPTFLTVAGTEWGFVALNLAGRVPTDRLAALERVRLQIGLARARTGRVIVFAHWGRENRAFPAPEQEAWAGLFTRWGATLVVGAHAHVVQPARCEQNAATYFGLGNLLFDQAAEANRAGLSVTCCPRGEGFSCTTARTERSVTSVYPTLSSLSPDDGAACAVEPKASDRAWLIHPARETFSFVQAFPSAGRSAFFALRRHWSEFDHENALRPYVFRVETEAEGPPRIIDVWRGTALARPLVAARLVDGHDGELLCAIHRADSFLSPEPSTMKRVRAVYRWTSFGFAGVDDPEALAACEAL